MNLLDRAGGVPASSILVPLGTALKAHTGGIGTAVVCLLLDCCNTSDSCSTGDRDSLGDSSNADSQLVLSGLEAVFVGCVACVMMPIDCFEQLVLLPRVLFFPCMQASACN